MPLPYTKRYGLKFAVNPPFTPYLGILFRDSELKYTRQIAHEKKVGKLIAEKIFNLHHISSIRLATLFLMPNHLFGQGLKLNRTILIC
jgi:hypothetical protein